MTLTLIVLGVLTASSGCLAWAWSRLKRADREWEVLEAREILRTITDPPGGVARPTRIATKDDRP